MANFRMDPKQAFIAFFILMVGQASSASDWSYSGDNGPSHWKDNHPSCGGRKQSPINIVSSKAEYNANLGAFSFQGFDSPPQAMTIKNNGHTAQVDLTLASKTSMTVSGGGLPGTYIPAQFHFHWGAENYKGSEHTINGEAAPLEMHIVCYNNKYSDLGEAAGKTPDGLAVLGFLFEVSGTDNEKFKPVIDNLEKVEEASTSKVSIPAVKLGQFLAGDLNGYYRYMGSLTTPGCNEVIVWSVFQQTIKISQNQLNEFRKLKSHDGDVIVDNFRPVQPLFGRKVMTSSENPPCPSSATRMASTACVFLVTILGKMMY